jgi:hypothetical protein
LTRHLEIGRQDGLRQRHDVIRVSPSRHGLNWLDELNRFADGPSVREDVLCYDVLMLPIPAGMLPALVNAARETPGLELLLLYGSRARGDAHDRSDWDFGYIAADDVDAPGLLARIVETVGSDRVDLVDLRRAGGLLRYRAARDGWTVFEAQPSRADRFRIDAVRFWCEAAPVLRRGYEAVLAELP